MTKHNVSTEPTPTLESHVFSEDGVDLTLIRWMLSMTPKERLMVLQNNVQSILKLRNAKRQR